jgi:hypothetical protein
MKKSKKAKREREPLYTRIHNDLIDLNLRPLLHMTLERLHRWADRETGIVKICSAIGWKRPVTTSGDTMPTRTPC